MDWHGLLAWIEVGETLRVQSDELEELISIRGDIDVHETFKIIFILLRTVPRPRKTLNIALLLCSRSSRTVASVCQSASRECTLKSSSYKERGSTENWSSRTHFAIVQDLGGGLHT